MSKLHLRSLPVAATDRAQLPRVLVTSSVLADMINPRNVPDRRRVAPRRGQVALLLRALVDAARMNDAANAVRFMLLATGHHSAIVEYRFKARLLRAGELIAVNLISARDMRNGGAAIRREAERRWVERPRHVAAPLSVAAAPAPQSAPAPVRVVGGIARREGLPPLVWAEFPHRGRRIRVDRWRGGDVQIYNARSRRRYKRPGAELVARGARVLRAVIAREARAS